MPGIMEVDLPISTSDCENNNKFDVLISASDCENNTFDVLISTSDCDNGVDPYVITAECDSLNKNIEEPGSEKQPNDKKRRKKSMVWDYFTVMTLEDGCTKAYCKECKKSFAYITGSKLAGTSHLKRHILLDICPARRQQNQLATGSVVSEPPKKRYRRSNGSVKKAPSFDQDRSNQEIAKMIIMHEYPPDIVEHQGFLSFVRILQPQFNILTSNTVQSDCVAMYHNEKEKLMNLISSIAGRVSLTLDFWTTDQDLTYVFLRGHFVDSEGNLHRTLLNVVMVPSLDSDTPNHQPVLSCLSDWHLEDRLLSLTVDQCFYNEAVMRHLEAHLCVRNSSIFNGQLLIRNCYARVLNHLALDALWAMRDTIWKVRESVKYVKTSEVHEKKFMELKQQLQVPGVKELSIDNNAKWDTTYHMLASACECKEVFSCLDATDPDYKMTLSMEEWKQIETLCKYLRHLFEAAKFLTGLQYLSANNFFSEVSNLQIQLTQAAMCHDPFTSNLVAPLQERFDKYWRDTCIILAGAVVMDPRFKMKLVEFTFRKLYGENAEAWIKVVDESLNELFIDYLSQGLSLPAPPTDDGSDGIKVEISQGEPLGLDGYLEGYDEYYITELGSQPAKTELEMYLEEPFLPKQQDFDVLKWWKERTAEYPTLSKMACDILAISVCTLPANSVFDTEIRKMDNHRSSLPSLTLEALICVKDWLQNESLQSSTSINTSKAIVKMEF